MKEETTNDNHANFSGSKFALCKLLLEKKYVSMKTEGGTIFVDLNLFSICAKLIS